MSFASFFAPDDSAPDQPAERRTAPFWLALFALAMFLPGFVGLPTTDRDEARFAQATKQMIQTGDYVDIRFQDEARNNKPVGIYWLQAAVVKAGEAAGVPEALTSIWLYRIPSLVGAIAATLLTYWAGLAFLSFRNAGLAALLLASTIVLGVEARIATTDAVLLATVVAAMGALGRIYVKHENNDPDSSFILPFIFWTAIGFGVLAKGPITPMIPALAAMALSLRDQSGRWLLRLRPLLGVIWAVAIAAPWLVMIALRTHGAFFEDSLGKDMLAKAASAKEFHGAPPGSYFVAFWFTAWPMSAFAALAAPFAWRARRDRQVAFLLAWLIPAWIVFELVPTKLPHYVLPLYPAVALLIGLALERGELSLAGRWRKVALAWAPMVAALLVAAIVVLAAWRKAEPGIPALVAFPLLVWRGIAFFRGWSKAEPRQRIGESALIAFLTYFAVYGGVLASPLGKNLMLTPQLLAAQGQALDQSGCSSFTTLTTQYREPGLVFALGADLKMSDAAGAAAFLGGGPCRAAFVSSADEKTFFDALPKSAGAPNLRRVRGYNFSRGRAETIDVWTRGR